MARPPHPGPRAWRRPGGPQQRLPRAAGRSRRLHRAIPCLLQRQGALEYSRTRPALHGQLKMATPMSSLLEEVSREHFPYPPASPEEIEKFERRVGWRLDPDLRAFYLHCNGAELIERLPDSPYQILPLSEIVRARVAIFGERNDD